MFYICNTPVGKLNLTSKEGSNLDVYTILKAAPEMRILQGTMHIDDFSGSRRVISGNLHKYLIRSINVLCAMNLVVH